MGLELSDDDPKIVKAKPPPLFYGVSPSRTETAEEMYKIYLEVWTIYYKEKKRIGWKKADKRYLEKAREQYEYLHLSEWERAKVDAKPDSF